MKKKTRTEPYKVYEVKHYVRARNVMEARRLIKNAEPHEIIIMSRQTAEGHAHYTEAVGYLEIPEEYEEVPDEYSEHNAGYERKNRS